MSSDTLLLNADYKPLSLSPLSTLTWQESIKLIWLDKINVVEWHDDWEVHSPSRTMKVPSVIAVREYVQQDREGINFSRRNVFIRDHYTCQYCSYPFNSKELTLDHVIPRSKGGKSGWDNMVTACKKCNLSKGSRTDIKPVRMPIKPNFYSLMSQKNFTLRIKYPVWLDYLDWPEEYIKLVA